MLAGLIPFVLEGSVPGLSPYLVDGHLPSMVSLSPNPPFFYKDLDILE